MTELLHETRVRLTFAAEGAAQGAGDLLDAARGRAATSAALIAAIAAAVLFLFQGPAGGAGQSAGPLQPSSHATLVEAPGYSLSLPPGWAATAAPAGAVFTASSADGMAETTLWMERARDLDFDSFVTQSLDGLEALGEDARVTDRVYGRTLETSTADLRADVPLDGTAPSPYHVTLRAAGPYRYYLATSIDPRAPASLLADAERLGSSLRSEAQPREITSVANSPAGATAAPQILGADAEARTTVAALLAGASLNADQATDLDPIDPAAGSDTELAFWLRAMGDAGTPTALAQLLGSGD